MREQLPRVSQLLDRNSGGLLRTLWPNYAIFSKIKSFSCWSPAFPKQSRLRPVHCPKSRTSGLLPWICNTAPTVTPARAPSASYLVIFGPQGGDKQFAKGPPSKPLALFRRRPQQRLFVQEWQDARPGCGPFSAPVSTDFIGEKRKQSRVSELPMHSFPQSNSEHLSRTPRAKTHPPVHAIGS